MFLRSMNDKQKDLFMKLAIRAAEANGVVELEEKNMLKAYGIEMGIVPFYTTGTETQDIVREIAEVSDEKIRRIIIFEILGIMISDSVFDEEEQKFVDELIRDLGISQQEKDEMLKLLYSYSDIYNDIVKLVLG